MHLLKVKSWVLILLFVPFLLLTNCKNDEEEPTPKFEKERVSGVVQKGPFISGTKININELNANLEQTGKIFTTELDGDDGKFEVNNVVLESGFVQLTGEGFYFNEVSGSLSSAQLNLFALSDITSDTSINVNLMTHLERRRVEKLISEGFDFSRAKATAQSEVLSVFGFNSSAIDASEKIDITQNTESSAILLAISVILQSDRTVAQLSELLANLSTELREDGIVGNEALMNDLREGAKSLNYQEIADNLNKRYEEIEISASVPDFGAKVDAFLTFTAQPPSIEMFTGESTSSDQISLSALINPNSSETNVRFEYGLTNGFGQTKAPANSVLTGVDPVEVNTKIGGLISDTTYYVRLVTDNIQGQVVSDTLEINTRARFTLSVDVIGEGAVSRQPDLEFYEQDTTVTVSAHPNTGYTFIGWSGDVSSSDSTIVLVMDSNKSLIATFEQNEYSITTTVSGEGTITKSPEKESYTHGEIVKLTAEPATGYTFKSWGGDISSSEPSLEIAIDGSKTITAIFEQNLYTIAITKEGEGTITKDPDKSSYIHGEKVTLTASASSGYTFASWSGDASGTETTIELTMDGNKDVTAKFNQNTYTVNVSSIGQGEVSKSPDKEAYIEGEKVIIAATANSGFTLKAWSGDASGNSQSIELVVNSNLNVTAEFTEMLYLFSNNVTVGCKYAKPGETGLFNGSTFKVVDEAMLRDLVSQDADLTTVCTSLVEDMTGLFTGKETFNQDINNWDVSNVTSMKRMFGGYPLNGAKRFNQPLDKWDVSNVTDMEDMFKYAIRFNQPLETWDVSNVTNMKGMFNGAEQFNQPLNAWDLTSLTNMELIFTGAKNFNQSLDKWNVSRVTNMSNSFAGATSFDQNINGWDLSSAKNLSGMFSGASSFNQPLDAWNTSAVTDISGIFSRATVFNQNIEAWDVSSVTNMRGAFSLATSFNQPLNKWNTSSVVNMDEMFGALAGDGAVSFNQPLNDWNVSNVLSMKSMFAGAYSFNQALDKWDVKNVDNMYQMFNRARAFDQNLSKWCVTLITSEPNGFSDFSPLSDSNKPIWGTCPGG